MKTDQAAFREFPSAGGEQKNSRGAASHPILIVGYGNQLRADDGVGCRLAEGIAQWEAPGVRVLVVPQLYPELASDIREARRVIFLDAREALKDAKVETSRLLGREESLPLGHALSPEGVVGLAKDLYGRDLDAWLVTIPAFEFAWREELSPRTASFLPEACEVVAGLIRSAVLQ
jgi:hydrogenase maturation protease